jgi:hypothetical protein
MSYYIPQLRQLLFHQCSAWSLNVHLQALSLHAFGLLTTDSGSPIIRIKYLISTLTSDSQRADLFINSKTSGMLGFSNARGMPHGVMRESWRCCKARRLFFFSTVLYTQGTVRWDH